MINQIVDILGIYDETQIFLLLFASIAVLLALIVFVIILIRARNRKKRKKQAKKSEDSPKKEAKKNKIKEEPKTNKEKPNLVAHKVEVKKTLDEISKEERMVLEMPFLSNDSPKTEERNETVPVVKETLPVIEEIKPIVTEIVQPKEKTTEELRKEIEEGKERVASREENLRKIQERLKELGLGANNFSTASSDVKSKANNEDKIELPQEEVVEVKIEVNSTFHADEKIENIDSNDESVIVDVKIEEEQRETPAELKENYIEIVKPEFSDHYSEGIETKNKDIIALDTELNSISEDTLNNDIENNTIEIIEIKEESENLEISNNIPEENTTEDIDIDTRTYSDEKRENNFSNEGGAIIEIKEIEQDKSHQAKEEIEAITITDNKIIMKDEVVIKNNQQEVNPKTFTEWLNSVSK